MATSNSSLQSRSTDVATSGSVFDCGINPTTLLSIKPDDVKHVNTIPLPKPLLIGTPTSSSQDGSGFDVLLLLHGFILYNSFYSQLIQHIASHGYIVIAPQLYTIAGPDSSDEIKATSSIIEWLAKGLEQILPPDIKPNIHRLAISGHSRGGKVAFALALKKVAISPLHISALIGIDPVDGMGIGQQTPPPVLTYVSQSFELEGMPILVIGSGLGAIKKNLFFPPCAPKGVNHHDFYNECQVPAWFFLVKNYGHLDLLNDNTYGIKGRATYCLCKNGESRKPMRRFVGGIIVAFLKAYLQGDYKELILIHDGHYAIPVEFDKVDCRT